MRKQSLLTVLLMYSISMIPHAFAADPRADFLKLIDRPKVPAAVEISEPTTADGVSQFHFTYGSDANNRVPGILLKSTDSTGRKPVVIALHGTGGSKNDELPLMRQLVAKGFIAIAIDGPYHGERTKAAKGVDYQDAIYKAYHEQKEHPFFYDTVWDVMRLIDYLETRDDIDAKRIGMYGVSKGGIETYLTAAVDPRVAVAVPCISVESFRYALDINTWSHRIETIQNAFDRVAKEENVEKPDSAFVKKFYDRVSPGIYGEFDGPSMVPLIAPRPLMTINGEIDPRTPPVGLKECTDAAQKLYDQANAADHFVIRIQPNTPHRVNPDSQVAAVDWFVKWLKP